MIFITNKLSEQRGFSLLTSMLVGAIIVSLIIVSYIVYTQERVLEDSHEIVDNTIQIEMTYDPMRQTTNAEQTQQIAYLDQKISESETDYERFNYLLQKATLLSVNRLEEIDEARLDEAQSILLQVYESTKSNLGYESIHENATWGYIFQFVTNQFHPSIVNALPIDIRSKHFAHISTADTGTILQRKVMEGMMHLADDTDYFSTLQNNKVFKSYAAFTRAVYLDSYVKDLSVEETDTVWQEIYFDIQSYNFGTYAGGISPAISHRTLLTAPTQIAFAQYVIDSTERTHASTSSTTEPSVLDFIRKPDATTTPIAIFDNTYKSLEDVIDIEPFGKALKLVNLKLFELGASYRVSNTEESVHQIVDAINMQLTTYPELRPIVMGRLAYYASPDGHWRTLYQDIFALAETSPAVASFLEGLEVPALQTKVDDGSLTN